MKEMIYIQAGDISNHVGTHFWNAQQSYFTYNKDKEVLVDHDVSFREGISLRGEQTYCPRLLQIDRKVNFGSLSRTTGLYAEEDTDETPSSLLWDGAVDEIRQDHIPESAYQSQLDEEVDQDTTGTTTDPKKSFIIPPLQSSDVQYWSDYNRVYYLPRSIHKLPDLADWGTADGDWQSGKETFLRYNVDSAIMDDSFRLFVEECDTFQGLQLCTDNASFGSFTNSLLTAFRDEFPKQPTLTFAVLSDAVPGDLDVDDLLGTRKALNDALCLQGLNDLSTMSVPLQSPSSWLLGPWTEELNTNLRSLYDTSAILSAHFETATLPLRLKSRELLYELCDQLNVYGNTPFAELSGAFPASSVDALDSRVHCFTTMSQSESEGKGHLQLCRRHVTRGWTELGRRQLSELSAIGSATTHSLHAQDEYPLPSSFPSFFRVQHLSAELLRTPRGILARPRSVPMVSTLASGRAFPHLLTRYANFVQNCVQRKINWTTTVGIEEDEARGLWDDMLTLTDDFHEGIGVEDEED
ncbi:Misato segment II tubulin-like domain-containing protein [Multifurca ochricompacta]|uniref:Misato segment II tubulin-like domain-containing protein n=1 Tax=Multifurca ochricompacta TaxID=376703 RepID=A0AAD4M4N6_9AGAM|nr:Misato segment II tubulin-like domain-containing protein [Multifurca ochricompacta]